MPLPTPKGRAGWIALAQVRVQRVLRARSSPRFASSRWKISRVRSPDRRAQPHILDTAIKDMVAAGDLVPMRPSGWSDERATLSTRRVTHPEPGHSPDEPAPGALPHAPDARADTRLLRRCAQRVFEATFLAAASAGYEYVGRLPNDDSGPLDGVWRLNGHLIGVEAKNVREWIYPSSERLWRMIRKCLVIDAVPLLVTREVAYITHVVCSRMGMLAFETHRQLFSPLIPPYYLTGIRHKDELGYKDVLTWDPDHRHPHLLTFLEKTLPRVLPATVAQWQASNRFCRSTRASLGGSSMTKRGRRCTAASRGRSFRGPSPRTAIPTRSRKTTTANRDSRSCLLAPRIRCVVPVIPAFLRYRPIARSSGSRLAGARVPGARSAASSSGRRARAAP